MIVSKQQRDCIDDNGNLTKELIISYVNKEGNISYLRYKVPFEQMFAWKYSTRKNADPYWKSYDNKFVAKYPTKSLNEMRLNEILCSFGDYINPMFEVNTPKTWFCDIETAVSGEGFSSPEDADNEINTIAITKYPDTVCFGKKQLTEDELKYIQEKLQTYSDLTHDYKFEYREYPNEAMMLQAFVEYIKPMPAITGWNFLEYDWTYIYNRCKKLEIDIESVSPTHELKQVSINAKSVQANAMVPLHKLIYDYLMVYRKWDQSIKVKENNTLDFVAEKSLGVKKVKHSVGFGEFYDKFYKDYVFYNLVDTILVEQIDKKLQTAKIWFTIAAELKIDLNMAFSTVAPTEVVMCQYAYKEHKVIPTKKKEDILAADYEGAFVWPSRPGVFKYVGALDFASLYPTTQRQFNISPETWLGKHDPKTYKLKENEIMTSSGSVYSKEKQGILPHILEDFFMKRKEAKKMKKQANSEYEELKHILEERQRNASA